jgi:hypothetical protein
MMANQSVNVSVFFFNFLMLLQKWWPAQEDLAKSGYNINREVENLGILFHAREPLEPIS